MTHFHLIYYVHVFNFLLLHVSTKRKTIVNEQTNNRCKNNNNNSIEAPSPSHHFAHRYAHRTKPTIGHNNLWYAHECLNRSASWVCVFFLPSFRFLLFFLSTFANSRQFFVFYAFSSWMAKNRLATWNDESKRLDISSKRVSLISSICQIFIPKLCVFFFSFGFGPTNKIYFYVCLALFADIKLSCVRQRVTESEGDAEIQIKRKRDAIGLVDSRFIGSFFLGMWFALTDTRRQLGWSKTDEYRRLDVSNLPIYSNSDIRHKVFFFFSHCCLLSDVMPWDEGTFCRLQFS